VAAAQQWRRQQQQQGYVQAYCRRKYGGKKLSLRPHEQSKSQGNGCCFDQSVGLCCSWDQNLHVIRATGLHQTAVYTAALSTVLWVEVLTPLVLT
jgi:hypothetical protein